MNISKLVDNACVCLETQHFTASTIYVNFKRHWNGLLKTAGADSEFNHQSVAEYLIEKCGKNLLIVDLSILPLKEYRIQHAFHSLIHYNDFGQFPSSSMASAIVRINLPAFENDCLSQYISYVDKDLGYSRSSLKYSFNTIHNYLISCPLTDICDDQILRYFMALGSNSKQTVKSKLKMIKRFLCYCYEMGFIKLNYSSLFPSNKLRSYTEVPSVYTPTEIFQLLEYIKSQDSPNKKRNYAIAVLIAVYGFRAGDIMKLKLSDIDWENEMIYIIQSKTLQQLTHKLTVHTGNALGDYLLNERPLTDYETVFLKNNGKEIGSSVTISSMMFNAFANSGIIVNGRKHGSHCLRHSLASNMLSNDSTIFEISKALGHTSLDTTRIYTKVDLSHLRLCELEVPSYE